MTDKQKPELGLAGQAYIYYFPLVFNLEQVNRFVESGMGQVPATGFNSFGHARTLATDADTFVTINNDTLYSIAPLDLSIGPVLLTVPPTGDRYFVLQMIDAWSNNIAYVGSRSTGGGGGTFVIVPPGYHGELPPDATPIHSSTSILTIFGRFACAGVDDLPAVGALQDELALTPLNKSTNPNAAALGVAPIEAVDDELRFWEKARTWSLAYPPSQADQDLQRQFAGLGTTATDSPYKHPDAELRSTLAAGIEQGKAMIEFVSRHGRSPVKNGWTVGLHAFDYNVTALELGTINEPEWRIDDPEVRYIERAVADRLGLWGNHGYEAVYCQAFTDIEGKPLDGAHSYAITFREDPPVDAFWSLTMYSVPDYFLVANPIHRYSIGDRTPGIERAESGELTITISHSTPTESRQLANWLPAPAGAFRLVLRLYRPRAEVLDLSYDFPPITAAPQSKRNPSPTEKSRSIR